MLFNKRNVQRNFKRNKDIILSGFGNAGIGSSLGGSSNDLALAQSRARQEYDSIRRNFVPGEKQDDDSYEVNKSVTFNQVIKAEIEKYNLHLDDKKIHITDEERTKWNKYKDNITNLEATVSAHTNTLATHTNTLATHTSKLADLASKISGNTSDISSLSSTVSSHSSDISSLESDVSSNTSDISSLSSSVSSHSSDISSLESRVSSLESQIASLQTAIDNLTK